MRLGTSYQRAKLEKNMKKNKYSCEKNIVFDEK